MQSYNSAEILLRLERYVFGNTIQTMQTCLCSCFMSFRWNQLDMAIVFLSVLGIVLEELKSDLMPINPTIMRVMRVLRIARGKKNIAQKIFQC